MLFSAPAYVICPASPRHVLQIRTYTDLIVEPSFLCQKSISARLLPLATRRAPAPCRSSARFAIEARCSSSQQQRPLHTRLSTTSEGPGPLSSRSHVLKPLASRLNSVASTSALAGRFVVNSCGPLLILKNRSSWMHHASTFMQLLVVVRAMVDGICECVETDIDRASSPMHNACLSQCGFIDQIDSFNDLL